ncbi:hypothetical protein MNBD_GAMMA04-579, partial [hydrothermal vent metagenome]
LGLNLLALGSGLNGTKLSLFSIKSKPVRTASNKGYVIDNTGGKQA